MYVGTGPFPSIIDLFGTAGGLIEYKASMMASRGIMTLALAYFDYDDLPDFFLDIDVDYFRVGLSFVYFHFHLSATFYVFLHFPWFRYRDMS